MDKLERRNFCTFFGDRYRYFILILGWFCLTSISANMIALNFTLICMVPQDTQEGVIHIPQNSTVISLKNVKDYGASSKLKL